MTPNRFRPFALLLLLLATCAGAPRKQRVEYSICSGTSASHLEAQWLTQQRVSVLDCELESAIGASIAYHERIGFFGNRLDGMRTIPNVGTDGMFEIQVTPNRSAPEGRSDKGADACVFCYYPFAEQRALDWRQFTILPNAFPYVPTDFEHVVLPTQKHQPQHYYPELLQDLIDFQRLARGARPLTLHYNGIAGNSQFHLHWQAMRKVLPLEKALDSGALPTEVIVKRPNGSVVSYQGKVLSGLLLSGEPSFVVAWATRIIHKLDEEPLVRGAYNLLLLNPKDGAPRLVIVPRRVDNLKPSLGSLGKRGLGAFNMAGVFVLTQPDVPADLAEALGPALLATVVPPGELPWLKNMSE